MRSWPLATPTGPLGCPNQQQSGYQLHATKRASPQAYRAKFENCFTPASNSTLPLQLVVMPCLAALTTLGEWREFLRSALHSGTGERLLLREGASAKLQIHWRPHTQPLSRLSFKVERVWSRRFTGGNMAPPDFSV